MRSASIVMLLGAALAAELGGGAAFAQRAACDRACLEGFVDRYLDALIDNARERLPLARDVRFTENGQRLEIGDGLWRSVKAKGRYRCG